jgi:hypothetical protein
VSDREGRADKIGHNEDRGHSEDEIIVFAHSRCLTAMAAATIHAMPPSAPIAEPNAARWFTKVGSDRSMATAPMAAPIVHKMAATRLQTSATTRAPQFRPRDSIFDLQDGQSRAGEVE